jgi:hypothetical protein
MTLCCAEVTSAKARSEGGSVVVLNIELQCNMYCLFSLSLSFWRVQCMGVIN